MHPPDLRCIGVVAACSGYYRVSRRVEVGCGCGRRLEMGSSRVFARRAGASAVFRAVLYLSIYLSGTPTPNCSAPCEPNHAAMRPVRDPHGIWLTPILPPLRQLERTCSPSSPSLSPALHPRPPKAARPPTLALALGSTQPGFLIPPTRTSPISTSMAQAARVRSTH